MNVLTDEEIRKWWSSENGLEDCVMCKIDDFEKVVRAIEAAVIKRLAAGVSVEPSFFNVMDGKTAYIPYYTPKQFTTAIAAARVAALKEGDSPPHRTPSYRAGTTQGDK